MIYRNIYKNLNEWASNPHHKPLILRGARQVGKTTIVEAFSREFDNFIHLNLEKPEDARFFTQADSVVDIMQEICFRQDISMEKGRTLLFIDEIQNEPKAVGLLRYFYEEMPQLYVIAAGSMLQSLTKSRISFPVGRVEYLRLAPCSFSEFLGAIKGDHYKIAVENATLPNGLHQEVLALFTIYTIIGGMPEIVADYAKHRDLTRLRRIYDTLLTSYNEDVEKYAPTQKQTHIIRHILDTGWSHSGQAITFTNFGGSGYLSKDVKEAFTIMERAFLLQLVYPATNVLAPLVVSYRRAPKLCWVDTGIVNYAANLQVTLMEKKNIIDTWKGAIAEHIVAQELRILLNNLYIKRLHFWVRDKKGSDAEVDFIWQQGSHIIPIEVKSGASAHLRSLQSFIDLSKGELAVRIWNGKYSVEDVETAKGNSFKLINIPFYYISALSTLIGRELPAQSSYDLSDFHQEYFGATKEEKRELIEQGFIKYDKEEREQEPLINRPQLEFIRQFRPEDNEENGVNEPRLNFFGHVVRKARQERNLTQSELGILTGVHQGIISKIENNSSDIKVSTILKVFEALDIKISFM